MRFDLSGLVFSAEPRREGYQLLPWSRRILKDHAYAKYLSFRDELDSGVFPCLGNLDGCQRLMKEISMRAGFVAEATWLIRYIDPKTQRVENCGTVQGICESGSVGSIQNLGVVPEHRGVGLGRVLLRHALLGFQGAGLAQATLEVTAQNTSALRLYQSVGFTICRTVFKSIDVNVC